MDSLGQARLPVRTTGNSGVRTEGRCPEDGLGVGSATDLTCKVYLELLETNTCALKKTNSGVFPLGFWTSLVSIIVYDSVGNNLWQWIKIQNSCILMRFLINLADPSISGVHGSLWKEIILSFGQWLLECSVTKSGNIQDGVESHHWSHSSKSPTLLGF